MGRRDTRQLLAGGETPWHALKQLALDLYEQRGSDAGPSVPQPGREISIRVFENPRYPTLPPRFVAEAVWEPNWAHVKP